MKKITVFTPTYNRAHTLHRVFESLKSQTINDFEWLVVDDGSNDGTGELIESWFSQANFPIKYIYQPNQGKHIAINKGISEVKTPYFLILDSDDSCVPIAIEVFLNQWHKLEGRTDFSAVVSLCKNEDETIQGKNFPYEVLDSDHITMTLKYRMKGEKWECFKTEILKKFPFPSEILNTVIPESLILNRIARNYKSRYISQALRIYHDDGADSSLVRVSNPAKNSKGGFYLYKDFLNSYTDYFWLNPWYFYLSTIKYIRNGYYQKIRFRDQIRTLEKYLCKILFVLALIPCKLVLIFEQFKKINLSGKNKWAST